MSLYVCPECGRELDDHNETTSDVIVEEPCGAADCSATPPERS